MTEREQYKKCKICDKTIKNKGILSYNNLCSEKCMWIYQEKTGRGIYM